MAPDDIIQQTKADIANALDSIKKFTINTAIRIYAPLDSIFNKYSPPVEKTYAENRALIWQVVIVMAVMGWVPLGWASLGIFLSVYSILKLRKISWHSRLFSVKFDAFMQKLDNFITGSKEEKESDKALNKNTLFLWKHILEWVGEKLNNAPLKALKLGLSTYIVLVAGMPWSLFVIYALYHSKTKVLEEIYTHAQSLQTQFFAFFKQLSNVKKLLLTLLGASFTVGIINTIMLNGVLLGIFDVSMLVLMLGLTVAGIRLGFKDFIQGTKNPINFFASKIGIILGVIEGNRLAHAIFYGKISGTLGHAYGAVQSSSVFSSLYGMLFTNNPFTHSAFQFNNTLLGGLFNRISVSLGGFLSNIFFTYDVSTYGYFYGTLGPTSLQLFLFMAVGGAVGHYVDKVVAKLSRSIKPDLDQAWENDPNTPSYSKSVKVLKQTVKFIKKYRSPFVMIPLVLFQPYISAIVFITVWSAPILFALYKKLTTPVPKPKPPIRLLSFDPTTLTPQEAAQMQFVKPPIALELSDTDRQPDFTSQEEAEPAQPVIIEEPVVPALAQESVTERLAALLQVPQQQGKGAAAAQQRKQPESEVLEPEPPVPVIISTPPKTASQTPEAESVPVPTTLPPSSEAQNLRNTP